MQQFRVLPVCLGTCANMPTSSLALPLCASSLSGISPLLSRLVIRPTACRLLGPRLSLPPEGCASPIACGRPAGLFFLGAAPVQADLSQVAHTFSILSGTALPPPLLLLGLLAPLPSPPFFFRRVSIQLLLGRPLKLDRAKELRRMFLPEVMSSPKPSWWEKAYPERREPTWPTRPMQRCWAFCFFRTSCVYRT